MADTVLPPERIFAALREALARRRDVFTYAASPENTALASSADRERSDEQSLLDTLAALSLSPQYALAVAEFDMAMERAGLRTLMQHAPDACFALDLMAARCFLAGKAAA